jgi:hypothetical protein
MIAKIAEISKSENSPRRHGDTEKISGGLSSQNRRLHNSIHTKELHIA